MFSLRSVPDNLPQTGQPFLALCFLDYIHVAFAEMTYLLFMVSACYSQSRTSPFTFTYSKCCKSSFKSKSSLSSSSLTSVRRLLLPPVGHFQGSPSWSSLVSNPMFCLSLPCNVNYCRARLPKSCVVASDPSVLLIMRMKLPRSTSVLPRR